jgi:repressor of nif and glnA expression
MFSGPEAERKNIATRYEALLSRKGMRANALRFQVLSVMAGEMKFTDAKAIKEKLDKKGISSDAEKVRYVIKRLSAAGLLEKKPVEKMNKFLFRLASLEQLEKQFSTR